MINVPDETLIALAALLIDHKTRVRRAAGFNLRDKGVVSSFANAAIVSRDFSCSGPRVIKTLVTSQSIFIPAEAWIALACFVTLYIARVERATGAKLGNKVSTCSFAQAAIISRDFFCHGPGVRNTLVAFQSIFIPAEASIALAAFLAIHEARIDRAAKAKLGDERVFTSYALAASSTSSSPVVQEFVGQTIILSDYKTYLCLFSPASAFPKFSVVVENLNWRVSSAFRSRG